MGPKSPFWRLAGRGVLIAAILAGLVGLAGWLLGWKTPAQFSDGIFMLGAVCIMIGVLSVMGGTYGRGDFRYQYARTAGNAASGDRNKQTAAEVAQGYGFALLLFAIGTLLILASILIAKIPG